MFKSIPTISLLILSIAFSASAVIIEVGAIDTPGEAVDVEVIGNYAYVADNQGGVRVIDISDPESPDEVGSYDSPDASRALVISGGYAFVADGAGGLRVLDVSQPDDPNEIGAFEPQMSMFVDVVVSEPYAYVADMFNGIRIIGVSDPENPQLVALFDTPDVPLGVFISGDYLFIADRNNGLQIVDVSDPENPQGIGACDTPGSAHSVVVAGGYAYAADDGSGLRVIDVSDPENPDEVGFFDTPGRAYGVAVAGHYAYIADGASGFQIINVSDPENPAEVGGLDTPGTAYGVDFAGGLCFVADGESGLWIIQLTPEIVVSDEELDFGEVDVGESEELTLTISNEGHADLIISDISVEGSYFSYDFEGEFVIEANQNRDGIISFAPRRAGVQEGSLIIISDDPNNGRTSVYLSGTCIGQISEVGYYDTPGTATDVAISNSWAFVTDGYSGLRVIDISNPENPDEVGYFDTPNYAWGVAVRDGFAYVADQTSGLRVIDVSDPENPDEIGYFNTPSHAWDVEISSGLAYVADRDNGLRVIDISSPARPREVGYYDTPGSNYGVAISGNYALLADWESGLRMIDISNPAQPREVGYYDTPGTAYGVAVYNGFAYVADFESGLRVIDISNPAQPREVGYYNTPGHAHGVAVSGAFAFVADIESGLRVIDVSDPENSAEVGSCDTPGHTYSVAASGGFAYVADSESGLRILDILAFVPGIIAFEPNRLDFGWVNVGEEAAARLTVANVGLNILTISDIQIEDDSFSSDFEGEFVLEPDENAEITVTFAPERGGVFTGTLTIISDDPNSEEVVVQLQGSGITTARVPLNEGWNLISINVSPTQEFYREGEDRGPDVISMMAQLRIDEDNHHVLIMKNENGRFYLPSFEYNDIPYWDLTEGYQVKVDADVEAVWAGEMIAADSDIPLNEGWNFAAYYPTFELNADAPEFYVLSPIIDHVLIAKDGDGHFLIPAWRYSDIPPWHEGQGYLVKVDSDVVLNYPPECEPRHCEESRQVGMTKQSPTDLFNNEIASLRSQRRNCPTTLYRNTGRNMSLLIVNRQSTIDNQVIGAFTEDGLCVGTSTIKTTPPSVEDGESLIGMAVWGDDPTTYEKDGLAEGESFVLRLSDGTPLNVSNVMAGDGLIYRTDDFSVVELECDAIVPTEYYLSDAFPNPFNSFTRLSFDLPVSGRVSISVFDITGRMIVNLTDGDWTAGHHWVSWDGSDFSSGIYLVKMQTRDFNTSRKVILLR